MNAVATRRPRVRTALRVLWAYLREASGDSAYDAYVAHTRQCHPGAPVQSRRDFERRRMDDRDARPESRCC